MSSKGVVVVEADKMGRAKCVKCRKVFVKGQIRTGVPMWLAGRQQTGWFCPKCFMAGVSVEECAKGNGGKCKKSGTKIEKGDFRCLIRCGNAKFGLGFNSAKTELGAAVGAAGTTFSKIVGAGKLPAKYKAKWAAGGKGKKPKGVKKG